MEQELSSIFKKLLNNECSPEEADAIINSLTNGRQEAIINKLIENQLAQKVSSSEISDELKAKLNKRLKLILSDTPAIPTNSNKATIINIVRYAVAACLIAGISIGLFFYLKKPTNHDVVKNITLKNDIAPGGNKATLTLSNGTTLVLDNSKNGMLASQGKTTIQKRANGLLTYQAAHSLPSEIAAEVTYNTVTTPRGGQYQVVLPDGTKVWLNAASSLKFPTAFTGKERDVELTGEAYFEVAKNKQMPFHVSSAGQVIEVLGTHFNINAYADEASIKTTLLEGSVKVTKGTASIIIKPGQQSIITNDQPAIQVLNNIDTEEVMAWKNGKFNFNNADIHTIMRQIGRWYNVDIEYEGKTPADHFKGEISRSVHVSQVLKIFELSGINFKIEGRKITVKS